MQNSDSQSLFSMSKRIRIFLKKFYWWISFVKHVFGYWHFLTTFTQLTTRRNFFLMGWLLVLGLEEGLVECATLCIKSWVILLNSEVLFGSQPRHLAAIHINLRQPAHAVTFMQHNVSLNDNCFVCVKIMKFSKLTRNVHVGSCL